MKTYLLPVVAVSALSLLSSPAANYADPGGAGDFTGGVGALDLTSVDVNNDATSVTFTLNLAGDPTAANWYNYFIGISRNLYGGVGGNLNDTGGWGKNIQMSVGGMDYFVGAYPAFAGYTLLTWAPSAWSSTSGSASQNSTSVTIPVALSALGLTAGDNFTFDVWTSTSGGDTVLDALSSGTPMSWNSNPWDTGANALSYTVQVVPEPSALALLALSGAFGLRRALRLKS